MVLDEIYISEEEILTALYTSAIEVGLINRRFEKGRIGLLFGVFARQLGSLITLMDEYVSQFSLETVTDEALLESLLKPYIIRRIASNSKVILEFTRDPTYNESIIIPAGFKVSTLGSNPIIFETVEDLYMWKGLKKAKVVAYCDEAGSIYNVEANTITYFVDSDYRAELTVTNNESAWGGRDDEPLEDARQRALSSSMRYLREGTYQDIINQIYELGIENRYFNIIEQYEGYGTVLISLDIDNNYEYEDIKEELNYNRVTGIKYTFEKTERIYLNMLVNVLLTGEKNLTYGESQALYKEIEDGIEGYFVTIMKVGEALSINYLKSYLIQQISPEFKLLNFDIKITNEDLEVEDNNIKINQIQNIYPNKITTILNYEGI